MQIPEEQFGLKLKIHDIQWLNMLWVKHDMITVVHLYSCNCLFGMFPLFLIHVSKDLVTLYCELKSQDIKKMSFDKSHTCWIKCVCIMCLVIPLEKNWFGNLLLLCDYNVLPYFLWYNNTWPEWELQQWIKRAKGNKSQQKDYVFMAICFFQCPMFAIHVPTLLNTVSFVARKCRSRWDVFVQNIKRRIIFSIVVLYIGKVFSQIRAL